MLATKLSSSLVAPSKVANLLDWRKAVGSVMSLDITRDRIGIAVAEHPEHICGSIPLESISLRHGKKSEMSRDLVAELEAAVRRHRVCAFVVNWPTNEGRMGEQCGKVLQVLDCVIDHSNSVVTKKRPFALWCHSETASHQSSPIDEWGRSTDFAQAPDYRTDMSYSSKSAARRAQSQDSSVVAANVLDEWVRSHWEIDSKVGRATVPKKPSTDFFFSTHSVDEYTNENACLQAALL